MLQHVTDLHDALNRFRSSAPRLTQWGQSLAEVLENGGRLLTAGNGGSASQAQHLAAELVGRYRTDRRPYAAIALCTDPSALTAIGNDYDFSDVFARQVIAHGRPGDILLLFSTSGRSPNVRRAACAGAEAGLTTWALTGPWPNPLAATCDDAITVDAATTASVQEIHLVALHMLCETFDAAIGVGAAERVRELAS
jgi:D-sedoheptulose 7-phosphate isomerase